MNNNCHSFGFEPRGRNEIKVEELVEKAKKKDEEAFNELILKMEKEMYLIAKTRLKNEDDIADSIQETILSCYKNLRKLKDNSSFKSWLIKILINECNNIYRKKSKQNISLDDDEMDKYIKSEDEQNIGFDMLIKNLDSEEQLILTLYYYSKYTTKEISKILKKNENTIKSKIIRARNKLRNQLEGENI